MFQIHWQPYSQAASDEYKEWQTTTYLVYCCGATTVVFERQELRTSQLAGLHEISSGCLIYLNMLLVGYIMKMTNTELQSK